MKALVYRGERDIGCENVADPVPEDAASAIVRIDCCGICGSDLHLYHGPGFGAPPGFCVGHESVGEVVEVGSDVQRFHTGQRVLVSGVVGCATCAACHRGLPTECANRAPRVFGVGQGLQGSQAEAVAVPAADTTLLAIPDGITDEQALLLTDNLPTGWFGAARADIRPGDSVAVVGLGPVGLLALESALLMGASRAYAIDPVPERRAGAEALGAIPISGDDVPAQIAEQTGGRGVDAVIEAVGADATIQLALDLVRAGGTVSVVGVSLSLAFPFPMAAALMRNITFRIGLCPIPTYWSTLIPLIQARRLQPERVVSHRMGLSEGAEAYRRFAAREDGVMKVALDPSA